MKILTFIFMVLVGLSVRSFGATTGVSVPNLGNVTINVLDSGPQETVNALKIVLLLTILTLAPAILIMMTSFTRIIVVLSFIRQAIGLQNLPPNQLLLSLGIFLTFFTMAPTFKMIKDRAVDPFLNNNVTQQKAIDEAILPLREFMLKQTRESDLKLMISLAKSTVPANRDSVEMHVLIPAFIVSELKTAFQIGFLLYLPFLIIDMVVASVLMAMGMMMMPPAMISLPLKVLLFVLVDGWSILVENLVKSFG